jgi:hypothetical protein
LIEDHRHLATANAAARSRWVRAATWALLLAVVALSGWLAYAFSFTTFRFQDDEGYFLLALRAYRAGRTLYGDIDTIYGPFYFEAVGGFFGLAHIPLNNDTARWFVLGAWVLACAGLFYFVRRLTGSVFAGTLAYFLAFPILSPLASAPLHPGVLIVLLLALLVLLTLGLREPARRTRVLAACGALTAAITLSKLNAGALLLIAFAAFFGRFAPRTRAGTCLRTGAALGLPLLPFVLMAAKLGDRDFRAFAWIVSLSLVPFSFLSALDSEEHSSLSTREEHSPPPMRRERSSLSICAYLWGGAASTSVVLGMCLFAGSTWNGLWQSLVVGTLHFSGTVFLLPPQFEVGAELAIALAAIPILLCARMRWMNWLRPEARALIKLAGGLTILVLGSGDLSNGMRALPLVWLVAVPGSTPKRDLEVRALFALLVVLLALHAYPVAGNQAVQFAYLLPAVGLVTVWDSFHELPLYGRVALSRTGWRAMGATAAIAAIALFHPVRVQAPRLMKQLSRGVSLELKGAEALRLSERRTAELEWMAENLEHHGETLLGIPGLHSFYFWTSLVPPVPFYPNTWVLFYDDAEQAKLAAALLASKRPCIVRNRAAIRFWTGKDVLAEGPMARAVEREFQSAGAVGEYELLLPRSTAPDLVLSILREPLPLPLRDRFRTDSAYRLTFPAMPGAHVARIALADPSQNLDLFDSATNAAEKHASIVNARGEDLLRGGASEFIDLSTRSDIFLVLPMSISELRPESALVRAYDASGRVLARLLMPGVAR